MSTQVTRLPEIDTTLCGQNGTPAPRLRRSLMDILRLELLLPTSRDADLELAYRLVRRERRSRRWARWFR